MSKEYDAVLTVNTIYKTKAPHWQYLLESYVGGEMYKAGQHLTRYINEEDDEYTRRLNATYLNNQCNSVVSVYNSFLHKNPPTRDLGSIKSLAETEQFLKDADYDGRSLNDFIEEVGTWASVFGHTWVMVAKPNVAAILEEGRTPTREDEISNGIRPYVSTMTPLTVLDWRFKRSFGGAYELVYLKYIEEVHNSEQTIREWTPKNIVTYVLDTETEEVISSETEVNGLGKIPAVIVYSKRATRGIGISDINDIAPAQQFDYNLNSETEQSIRVDSHPSIVATKDTDCGSGAGSRITPPDNLPADEWPTTLEFNGANIENILDTKVSVVDAVDSMANTGSVRSTEAKIASGIAQQTEFQLLDARLSGKANNLELAEEQMWSLFAMYLGKTWDGKIEYPGSFNIQDEQFTLDKANVFEKLVAAWKQGAVDFEAVFNYMKALNLIEPDADMDELVQKIKAEEAERFASEVESFNA